jgi:hypothetical protein
VEGLVVDRLELQVDAGELQLGLEDLRRVEHRRQGRLDRLHGDAVREAGFLQQRLRLGDVVRRERRLGVGAEIAGGNDRDLRVGGEVSLEAHDLLAVDRVRDRLAHALVVEGLHRHVQVQHAELGRAQHVDDHARLLLEALGPLLVLAAVDDVELARGEREIARRVGRNQAIDDAIDLRRAAEVVLVGDEGHALVRLVGLELERAGADRVQAEVVAELLNRLPADDHAAVVVGDEAEEERHRLLELDAHRGRVERLDRFDRRVVARERRRLRVGGALEREDDVVGGERAEVAVELDALPQVKRPRQLVGRALPALGEIGLERLEARRAGLEAHEAVVEPRGERLVLRRRRAVGVELTHVGGRHADVEHRLGVDACGEDESRGGGAEMSLHGVFPRCASAVVHSLVPGRRMIATGCSANAPRGAR